MSGKIREYQVSLRGCSQGIYWGATKAEALIGFFRENRYTTEQVWIGADGKINYASDDIKNALGDIKDYQIERA
jgi:hypothetical protein